MKKKLCVLLVGLCFVLVPACGNKVVSDNSDNIIASEDSDNSENDNDGGVMEGDGAEVTSETEADSDDEADSDEKADSDNEESGDVDSEDAETEDTDADQELVDGMRPEFKEAMDSYEIFYDEYCDIMKKYAENPSDMEILTSYTDMLKKGAEMTEKFEAWEDSEMNDAELKYYLDVNNRVTKKLLDVSK